MKKITLAITLLASPLLSVAAETGPGCGWGSMLMDGKSGKTYNVLAATTNGTFGNQTFGITSGTAGCDGSKTIHRAATDFLDDNMEKVAKDMSTGQGESLDTLASLMGIEEQDKVKFFEVTHDNFSTIFPSDSASSVEVMASIEEVMVSDATLSKYVS